MVGGVVLVLVVFSLLVLPVGGLVIQVWRDWRGSRRNTELRCYACGQARMLLPVSHYKGDTFLYCRPCANRQAQLSSTVVLIAVGVIVIVGFLAWLVLWLIARGS